MSSIPIMLDYLSKPGTESENTATVRKVFSHRDYQFEIRRYGLTSVEPLILYFSGLKSIQVKDIPDLSNERKNTLRDKHDRWLDCLSDPEKYYNRYKKVKDILCEENIVDLQHKLADAFPKTVSMDDAGIVSTLSFGPSFGYVYENALHLDLFGIEEVCTTQDLPYVILHELHHLQVQKLIGSYGAFTRNFSLLEEYIFRFTGEGLAIKFCNNAEGRISKRLDKHLRANIGLSAMDVLNRHFEEHFRLFNDTVRKIRRGEITETELDDQFRAYWWNPTLYEKEAAFLEQTPIYSFGNEIFGCIYDAFGLETLFECFYDPVKTIEYFNKANCGYVISEKDEESTACLQIAKSIEPSYEWNKIEESP